MRIRTGRERQAEPTAVERRAPVRPARVRGRDLPAKDRMGALPGAGQPAVHPAPVRAGPTPPDPGPVDQPRPGVGPVVPRRRAGHRPRPRRARPRTRAPTRSRSSPVGAARHGTERRAAPTGRSTRRNMPIRASTGLSTRPARAAPEPRASTTSRPKRSMRPSRHLRPTTSTPDKARARLRRVVRRRPDRPQTEGRRRRPDRHDRHGSIEDAPADRTTPEASDRATSQPDRGTRPPRAVVKRPGRPSPGPTAHPGSGHGPRRPSEIRGTQAATVRRVAESAR